MQTTKVFKSGNSQAVRLPKQFQFTGIEEVYIKKQGDAIILIPKEKRWDILFESLNEFSDDFLKDREQPKEQERGEFF